MQKRLVEDGTERSSWAFKRITGRRTSCQRSLQKISSMSEIRFPKGHGKIKAAGTVCFCRMPTTKFSSWTFIEFHPVPTWPVGMGSSPIRARESESNSISKFRFAPLNNTIHSKNKNLSRRTSTVFGNVVMNCKFDVWWNRNFRKYVVLG